MDIYYTNKHKLHNTDAILVNGKPFDTQEIPQRAEIILNTLQEKQLGSLYEPVDHGLDPILQVHTPDYIHYLQTIYEENARFYQSDEPVLPETFAPRGALYRPNICIGLAGYYSYGTGSPILQGTWEAAYWSAQCALSAADRVKQGFTSYALCRPPGHHAGKSWYGGYCYINNAAVAARYMGEQTAILDIDYHHGNGTQDIFYEDPSIFYCSLHAHPDDDYPFYWGSDTEIGEAEGLGYNRNYPLPQQIEDSSYLRIIEEAVSVIADFRPNYLVISAGFDIVKDDPCGGFNLSTSCLYEIGKLISSLSLPTLIVQEGGYLLSRLGINVITFLNAFQP